MRKIKSFLFVFVLAFCQHGYVAMAQVDYSNFGFTGKSTNSHVVVKPGKEIVALNNNVFFVGTDNKIYALYWTGTAWTGGTTPLVSSATDVRANAQIVYDGSGICYVGTDNLIHRIFYSTSWQHESVLPSMNPVRDDNTNIFPFWGHIFYVNSNNKVCDVIKSGGVWSGGQQLVWTPTVNVVANTNIVVTPNHVFFVGDYYSNGAEKLYDLFWDGNNWLGGNWPLCNAAPTLNPSFKFTHTGNEIFYVNDNNYLCRLYYTTGWNYNNYEGTTNAQPVKNGNQILYHDDYVYFVANSTSKVSALKKTSGIWNYYPGSLNSSSSNVLANSRLFAFTNYVPQEGNATIMNPSYHLLYTDVNYKLKYLVFDDEICETVEGCSTLTGRIWHYGGLFHESYKNIFGVNRAKVRGDNNFAISDIGIFYIGSTNNLPSTLDNRIHYITRNFTNDLNCYNTKGYYITYNDEFTSMSATTNKWYSQGLYGNGPSPYGSDQNFAYYNYFKNMSIVDSDFLKIETKAVTTNDTLKVYGWHNLGGHFGYFDHLGPVCDAIDTIYEPYTHTSGALQSGGQNLANWTFNSSMPCVDYTNGALPDPYGAPKFTQKYGWFEIRTQSPRGRYMWGGLWIYNHTNGGEEIDVNEVNGNGKLLCQNLYHNWSDGWVAGEDAPRHISAVGYRFTDNEYTYSCVWTSSSLKFYFNNELTATILPTEGALPENPVWLQLSTYVKWTSLTESEIFPNYRYVDYIRVAYPGKPKQSIPILSNNTNNPIEYSVELYPNPSNDFINVVVNDGAITPTRYEIYSVLGEKKTELSNSTGKIDISGLPVGIYFLRIYANGCIMQRKFIKE